MARLPNSDRVKSAVNGPVRPDQVHGNLSSGVTPHTPPSLSSAHPPSGGGGTGGPTAVLQQKLGSFREELGDTLIEMEDAIDCILTGLVNGGNVFLMGPPGTGKSFLCEGVCNWVQGLFFNLLLSPTSIPEELFGPVSLKSLRDLDVMRRNITDCLPEANIAFLDEAMKAPSAILTALLKIMNERVYHNGPGNHVACPIRMVVGASNEFAGAGDEAVASFLAPFWDRFLYRTVLTGKLTREGRDRLMRDPQRKITPSTSLSLAELDQVQAEAKALPVLDETWEAFTRILDELEVAHEIAPSPRRLSQLAHGGIQAFAYLMGADHVRPEHLEVLQWCLWTEGSTEQMHQVKNCVLPIANPTAAKLTEFRQMVSEEMGKVARVDHRNDAAVTNVAIAVLGNLKGILGGIKKLPRTRQTEQLIKYVEAQQPQLYRAATGNSR